MKSGWWSVWDARIGGAHPLCWIVTIGAFALIVLGNLF